MIAILVAARQHYKRPHHGASGAPPNAAIAAISDRGDKVLDLPFDRFLSERFEFMPRKSHV
jgi:hypothetical protein